jgi:hypothetical protein
MRRIVRDTSRQAYEEMKQANATVQSSVYDSLAGAGPMTAMELERFMGRSKSGTQIRARLNELRKLGLVYEAGKSICKISNKKVILWSISP